MGEFEKCKIGFEINNELYTNFKDDNVFGTNKFITIDLKSFKLLSPTKILIDMRSIDDVDAFKLKLPQDCNIIVTDNGKLGQIMAKGVNKLNGLRCILDKLGASLERVVFFGDDINDIELLKACGTGVAMGNAVDEVKSIADFVTTSNDEDGIAVFLNKVNK